MKTDYKGCMSCACADLKSASAHCGDLYDMPEDTYIALYPVARAVLAIAETLYAKELREAARSTTAPLFDTEED